MLDFILVSIVKKKTNALQESKRLQGSAPCNSYANKTDSTEAKSHYKISMYACMCMR